MSVPGTVILTTNQKFWAMREASKRAWKPTISDPNQEVLFALDPGETTGVAIKYPWHETEITLFQLATPTVEEGYQAILDALPVTNLPVRWIVEDYRVYSWKSNDHKWAGLHTPQLIGAIRSLRYQRAARGDTIQFRMAQQAKAFATDDNLKSWGIYNAGLKHARDAERHLVTTLFFG